MQKKDPFSNLENLESAPVIGQATQADVQGILRIQESRSLEKSLHEGLTLDELQRSGFLVHLLSEEELIEIINMPESVRTLVYRDGDEVVGYAVGYLMRLWMEKNPEWIKGVKLKEGISPDEISDDSTIYLRHVATLPVPGKSGMGARLSKELVRISKEQGFENIMGEILKEPYFNRVSFAVHDRLKFKEIGEIDEVYKDKKYKWGLFRRPLTEGDEDLSKQT